jgi:FkbM family methyltransferase
VSDLISHAVRQVESRHRGWRYRTRIDPDEIRWMRSFLRPGDTAVDVGAYKGGYTYWMQQQVGPSRQVYSFEPQPEAARFLRCAVRAVSWANEPVEEAGLTASRGRGTLRAPKGWPVAARVLVRRSGQSLDEFFSDHSAGPRVTLIKCDVEGHELDVFQGAEKTLTKDQPHLLLECEGRHRPSRSVVDVFAHLQKLGYRGSFFWNGKRLDVRDFDLARHQAEDRKPYVSNFLFEPV